MINCENCCMLSIVKRQRANSFQDDNGMIKLHACISWCAIRQTSKSIDVQTKLTLPWYWEVVDWAMTGTPCHHNIIIGDVEYPGQNWKFGVIPKLLATKFSILVINICLSFEMNLIGGKETCTTTRLILSIYWAYVTHGQQQNQVSGTY